MPNQNPADVSGANAFGRWDYGPWFWPPQDPTTFVPSGLPFPCDSSIYSATNPPAFPPLICPGTPNPSGVPEGFMDTSIVNGTAYPTLTVDPTAYRFQILSAGNDRTLNLGLYMADPLTIAVTNGGSGYTLPPTVVFNPPTGTPAATCRDLRRRRDVLQRHRRRLRIHRRSERHRRWRRDGRHCPCSLRWRDRPGHRSRPRCLRRRVHLRHRGDRSAVHGCTAGCLTATADAIVTPSGSVMAINVTTAGGPWTAAPQISLVNAAGDTTGAGATAMASVNTEVKMVDAVPHTASSALQAVRTSNPISGSQLVTAILDASGNPLNGTGLPANCYPSTWPTDGRDGGVPDPTTAGPPFIEIASEGGLLPNPVVIPSTPVGYEYNRRSITVLNVWNHGLLLGPAERADVVVDFSKFAGTDPHPLQRRARAGAGVRPAQ